MKRLFTTITIIFIVGMSNFALSKTPPPINRDSISGYISMTIDSGTCYSRYISARLYDNLLTFHHWEKSNDGFTYSTVSTSPTLTLSNISDKFWIRALVKTGNDSCYTDTVLYNEVCAYDTIRIDSMYNVGLSGNSRYLNTSFKNHENIYSKCWTIGGPDPGRTLLRIDFSAIPLRSIIKKSTIFLFSDLRTEHVHSSLTKSNASYFHRIDSTWNFNAVTWNNQPRVSIADSVVLPKIDSITVSASFDITNYVKRWCASPSLNYGLRMMVKTESPYCRQSYYSRNITGADTVKRPYVQVIYYKPQIIINTRGYNTNGDSIFYKAEVGNYRKTYYSGLKQYLILDSLKTYPSNIDLKFYKKGSQNDTSIIRINVDSNFNIKTVKINTNGTYVNYLTDNYSVFDNKITFYAENSKKDDFSNYFKLNLKNGLKMILFPSGNTTSSDTIWSKLYVSGTIPTNSKFCLIVYDSFNNVVYKTYNPTDKWDGKINNVFISESSYKYALYINDLIYRGQFFVEYK